MTIASVLSRLTRASARPPRRADRSRQAARRRSVFALERFEDRTLLSGVWTGAGGDNLWSTAANWSDGVLPTWTTPVTLDSTDAVVLDGNPSIWSLTIQDSASLDLNGHTLSVNANVNNHGATGYTQSGGSVTGTGASEIIVGGNFTSGGGAFSVNNVTFKGVATSTVDSTIAFNNVTIAYGGMHFQVANGKPLDVNGKLTITSYNKIVGDIKASGNVVTSAPWSSNISAYGYLILDGSGPQTLDGAGGVGNLPNVVNAKTNNSTLTLTGTITPVNWTQTSGQLSAAGSTTVFRSGYTSIDTGSTSLGNVVVDMGGNHFKVKQLKVGGNLSIQSAQTFKKVAGGPLTDQLTVSGDVSSTAMSTIAGDLGITMVGGDGKKIYTGSDFNNPGTGYFPNTGIVIKKNGNNLQAAVSTPLTGPLVIDSVGAFGGSFAVAGNVAINTGSITSWNGGKLVFQGGNNQNVTTTNGGRLPGVVLDKSGGTLNLPTSIDVVGNWKYEQGLMSSVNIRFLGGDKSVDGGSLVFNNVEINADSLNASNPLKTMIVGGTLTLTRAGAMGGVIEARGDVDTAATVNLYSANGGKILFNGSGAQTLTATAADGRVPGVEIDKSGGSLTLDSGNVIDVSGSWKYVKGTVDTAGTTVKFIGGDKSVDAAGMTFNNLEFNVDSLNASNPLKTVIVDGKLTLSRLGAVGGVIEAHGDVDTAATVSLYSANGGKILFSGAGDQTLTATADHGRIPGVEINKSGGSLTLDSGNVIDVAGSWKYIKGTVGAANSTVKFIGGDKAVDSGASPKMTFGNVEIAIDGNSLNATNMAVGGNLTITSVNAISAASGKITVGGDLTSTDTSVSGNADITMTGGDNAMITADPGDFPSGGIVITKGKDATVHANVTTPLDGPLALKGSYAAAALTGTFQVANNVSSETQTIAGNSDGSPVIVFKGNKAQTLTTSYNNQVNKMVPGLGIDKSGGSLSINDSLTVSGGWIVTGNNTAPVNIAAGKTVTFANTGAAHRTIDTGDSAGFQNVVMNPAANTTVAIHKMTVLGDLKLPNIDYNLAGPAPIDVYGDVETSITNKNLFDGATGAIRFVGTGNQTLTANSNGAMVPNIIIEKGNAGTLTINAPSAPSAKALRVMGDWTHLSGNVDTTGSSIQFGKTTGQTIIKPGSMTFNKIAFLGGVTGVDIVAADGDTPATLYYTGSVTNPGKVTKGFLTPQP